MKKGLLFGVIAAACLFGPLESNATPINVAGIYGTTSGSAGVPNDATDGNLDSYFSAGGSDTSYAFWQLDLGHSLLIDTIKLSRYSNAGSHVFPELYNFTISLFDSQGVSTHTHLVLGPVASIYTLDLFPDVWAESIRIELNHSGCLELSEVEVMAEPVPEPSTMVLFGVGITSVLVVSSKKRRLSYCS